MSTENILFLYSGDLGDFGWTFTHNAARIRILEDYAVNATYEIVEDDGNEEHVKEKIMSAVDRYYGYGFRVFFGCSFGFQFGLFNRSLVHTDAYFVGVSGFLNNDRMASAFGTIYQATYLEGIVAGLMTKNNKACWLSAVPIPEVYSNFNAFAIGLHESNPNATAYTAWTGTWYNPELERYTAEVLYNASGCDVLGQHSDTHNALEFILEKGGYGLGFNSDTFPSLGDSILTSAVWNWFPLYNNLLQMIWNNSLPANTSLLWGIDTGLVDITRFSSKVPRDIRNKTLEAKARLLERIKQTGTGGVFCGPNFNLPANACLNASQVGSFDPDAPNMSALKRAPFNAIDLGMIKMPETKTDPCLGYDCHAGTCAVSASGPICSCPAAYYGSHCQNSIVGPIVGGAAGFLVLLLIFTFRKKIQNLLTGNLDSSVKDPSAVQEDRTTLLDAETKAKMKMQMFLIGASILRLVAVLVFEWVGFANIISYRFQVLPRVKEFPSILHKGSIVSVLSLDDPVVDIPPIMAVYLVFCLVSSLFLLYKIQYLSRTFYRSYENIKKGVSAKKILKELMLNYSPEEVMHDNNQDQSVSEIGSGSTNETASQANGRQQKSLEVLLELKRKMIENAVDLIILFLTEIPFLIIKFYMLQELLKIIEVPLSDYKQITLSIDILLGGARLGMLANVPRVYLTLRFSARYAILQLNERVAKHRLSKSNKKTSVVERSAPESPTGLGPQIPIENKRLSMIGRASQV